MRLGELQEWENNPRQLSKHDAEHIQRSIEEFGLADPLIVNADGSLIGGHMRKRVLLSNGAKPGDEVDVRYPDRQLTEREAEELAIRLNKNSGDWNWDTLANAFEVDDLLDWGFTEHDLGIDNPINFDEHWKGMPETDNEDLAAVKIIKVHFASLEDIEPFSKLIDQPLTENTRSIWFPKAKK